MKTIPITKGYSVMVDDEDYEWLSKYKWQVSIVGHDLVYARRGERTSDSPRKMFFTCMHQQIMGSMHGKEIDHINGNGLDNRRVNLRFVTHSQNCQNRNRVCGKSKFKGVCWHKWNKKWVANIKKGGHPYFLGYYKNEDEAASAYDEAAKRLFGEFAMTNKEIHAPVQEGE